MSLYLEFPLVPRVPRESHGNVVAALILREWEWERE